MSIARSAALLVLVGVGISSLSGCIQLTTPCYTKLYRPVFGSSGEDVYSPPSNAFEGTWTLTKISSVAIPPTGVDLPGAKGKRFLRGSLRFYTEDFYFSDDCNKLLRERGVVRADYTTQKPGEPEKVAEFWGKFVVDHEDKKLTLRAADKSGEATFSPTQFDITVVFPTDFIDVPVQFHFDRFR